MHLQCLPSSAEVESRSAGRPPFATVEELSDWTLAGGRVPAEALALSSHQPHFVVLPPGKKQHHPCRYSVPHFAVKVTLWRCYSFLSPLPALSNDAQVRHTPASVPPFRTWSASSLSGSSSSQAEVNGCWPWCFSFHFGRKLVPFPTRVAF